MTGLIEAPDANTAQTAVVTEALPPNGGDRSLEWAPREPAPKKRRIGLWVGVAVGVLALGAAAASTILIAPGTTIAGVPVGGLTPGAAADVVTAHLANTEITLTDAGGDQVVTGSDLGASIDARGLADEAFASHPMWNIGAWMPEPIVGTITLDTDLAHDTLREMVPSSYEDAVDATVGFDAASATYVTTPAVPGTGVDLDGLTGALTSALADGGDALTYSGDPAEAPAPVSDEDAAGVAEKLNTMLTTIGFYVGDERTVPIAPAVAATWLEVVDQDGELNIVADEAAIQATVDALPAAVNRAPVNAESIVNAGGDVLEELTVGVSGRTLGDTSTVASDFAEQLEAGNSVQPIEVSETPFASTTLTREIDINLANQTVSAIENGVVVDSWSVSSGAGEFATHTGSFQIGWKTSSQNMGNRDLSQAPNYFQPDVKWVMYFNGDEALHGVYWHSNWGTPMSHGCVGMPEYAAQWLYNWAPEGVNVYVHY
ncbi:L,D-transpeptidase family protein [Microbacterium murale]|uniref:Lipoprotein-anchoring transpeptidase ErfK/SrfK n=1 Tax=Microbacterium murale TaxID=1081040 RepID=A0ABU0PDG7_9MICO|nr:L,D-transpeptidase family protein [Microbacterium murale]MDQ0644726.1 lipoprotein-anchoring transpeptidase ErfK/SrfK [Microbacterium murale]